MLFVCEMTLSAPHLNHGMILPQRCACVGRQFNLEQKTNVPAIFGAHRLSLPFISEVPGRSAALGCPLLRKKRTKEFLDMRLQLFDPQATYSTTAPRGLQIIL